MRRHQFKGSEFDVLPLGGPVDPAAVTADDALIDTLADDALIELLADDALIELLADDALIEALVARMPSGTAPPPRRGPPRRRPGRATGPAAGRVGGRGAGVRAAALECGRDWSIRS